MSREAGFALPAAIFLLVVLGGLAVWLARLIQADTAQEALALEGERAYQAARAGLEIGLYHARRGVCPPPQRNIPLSGALARFTASVSCQAHAEDEGGSTFTIYVLESVACNEPANGACPNPNPGQLEYAQRRLHATMEAP